MGAATSPILGLFGGAVGTGMSTAAAYRDAQAANAANQLNAQMYEQNAALSRLRAGETRKMGEIEYGDVLRKFETLRGEQRAAYGASGVSVNAGSAREVQANTAAEGNYEANKTKYQRDLEAWQMEQEAANYEFEALKARSNTVNPWMSAGTAAIGGMTTMYSTYGQWRK